MKKILYIFLGLSLMFACSDDEGNPCIYEPTLTTEAATNIAETSATLNGVISIVSENCDAPNNTEQGFVYSTEIQPTLADTQVNVNGTNVLTTIEGLESNTTYYVRAFLTNTFGDFYGNEVSFNTEEGCDVVYLDDNGITIKAFDCANIGDIGVVNGIAYTVLDYQTLKGKILNGQDVTKVCTTKITDMSQLLFINNTSTSSFNQDIGSWDLSNVTNMFGMLQSSDAFNQDIGDWDVSNVTDMDLLFNNTVFNQDIGDWDVSSVSSMRQMFAGSSFNQDISSWDLSNVTNMAYMFLDSEFNQDIGDWDVSNVIEMESTFYNSMFNQDIGNWDVSNVTDMDTLFKNSVFNQDIGNWDVSSLTSMVGVFQNSVFNQDIGDWDVSGVTDMYWVFESSLFNQDIGDWDVSNVTYMREMFQYAAFNQDIGDWDVSNVTDMRNMFYANLAFNQDIGEWDVSNVNNMQGMFWADQISSSFNQDLSMWDVSNEPLCQNFCIGNTQWTLPKPNFTTNCCF